MKTIAWSIGAAAALAVALGVGIGVRGNALSGEAAEPTAAQPASQTLVLGVERMTCGSCEARIREALKETPGVTAVAVDLASRTVAVEYAAGTGDPRALAEAVSRAGYPARFLGFGVMPVSARSGAGSGARKGCGGGCCPPG